MRRVEVEKEKTFVASYQLELLNEVCLRLAARVQILRRENRRLRQQLEDNIQMRENPPARIQRR